MSNFAVGLTGGLASGKTTVLNIFKSLGVATLSADCIVHELMNINGLAYRHIVDHFSEEILMPDKKINRDKLRELIFNSSKEKDWLESYLHPIVRDGLFEQFKTASSSYVIIEIPLLAESNGQYPWINRILVVDCDEETQCLRARQRSGLSYAAAQKIIQQQATRERRNSIADDILLNKGDTLSIEYQVKKLHDQYRWLNKG